MPAAATVQADAEEAARTEIRRLGLETYREDLDEQGFTIIPPEIANPNGLHERLLEAVLDVTERRNGVRPDLDGGSTHERVQGYYARGGKDSPFGETLPVLIQEGPVFEEALLNPVLLAMTTYKVGYSMILSSMLGLLKGPNRQALNFHTDTLLPPPWPEHALVCNATYVLTEYTRENGCLAFVPGSHKLCRGPKGSEANVFENPDTFPVEVPAGTMVFWHGNTWHGAFNRTSEGLRVSITTLMARPWMRTEEDLAGKIPQEALDRNPLRFAILTHQGLSYGFGTYKDVEERQARSIKYTKAYYEETGGLPALNPLEYETKPPLRVVGGIPNPA